MGLFNATDDSLIELLIGLYSGTLSESATEYHDAVYAVKRDLVFRADSHSRSGSSKYNGGGVLDDHEFFATFEYIQGAMDTDLARDYYDLRAVNRYNIQDAAQHVIDAINERIKRER